MKMFTAFAFLLLTAIASTHAEELDLFFWAVNLGFGAPQHYLRELSFSFTLMKYSTIIYCVASDLSSRQPRVPFFPLVANCGPRDDSLSVTFSIQRPLPTLELRADLDVTPVIAGSLHLNFVMNDKRPDGSGRTAFDVVLSEFEYAQLKREAESPVNFYALGTGYKRISTYG